MATPISPSQDAGVVEKNEEQSQSSSVSKKRKMDHDEPHARSRPNEDNTSLPRKTSLTTYFEGGDLILIVGREQERMLVHSTIMKTSSSVFQAMLGPHFAEGQRLREAGSIPIEIKLPEDDTRAFRLLCTILCKGDDKVLTAELSSQALHSTAILIDKYDLKDRLSFVIPFLLLEPRDEVDKSSSDQIWHAALAAYWLSDSDSFYDFTKMTVESNDSYLSFVGEISDEIIGLRLCLAVEQWRNRVRQGFTLRGLCLECFAVEEKDFLHPMPGCERCKSKRVKK